MDITALENELKAGKLNNIYLLYGEEKFLLENSLKKIKNLFGECLKGINYITIDILFACEMNNYISFYFSIENITPHKK